MFRIRHMLHDTVWLRYAQTHKFFSLRKHFSEPISSPTAGNLLMYIRQPIEWLVLAKDIKNGKALLLSKYVLDWEGFANCPIGGSG